MQLKGGTEAPDVTVDGLGLLWPCVPLAIRLLLLLRPCAAADATVAALWG